jgi:serine/threonine protein kinase
MPVLSSEMSPSPAEPDLVAGRYRLAEPLGQGGMGRVWKARDEILRRDVAIKEIVPPPGLTEQERQEMRERSLREARAIARLNHINVVRVFDVVRTEGDPWIVMEYVASRSLQDVLTADGPVSQQRAAEIGLEVLAALQAAHRAGVVHRDVKPSNVLLGDEGRVVLTDFGLATVPGDPNVTRTGLVLGSPAYISPERARDGTAGPPADMWSLGATIFAAVEGQSPFARATAIATLTAVASEPLPPPRKATGPLKAALTGLLRKDPGSRLQAHDAERLLLRAAGRSQRGMPLLPGMRRPGSTPRQNRPRVPELAAGPAQPVSPAAAELPTNLVPEPTKVVPPADQATELVAPSPADPPEPATSAPAPAESGAPPDPTRLDLARVDPDPVQDGPAKAPTLKAAEAEADAPATAKQASPPSTDTPGETSPEDLVPAAPFLTTGRRWLAVALIAAVAFTFAVVVPLIRGNGGGRETSLTASPGSSASAATARPSSRTSTASPTAAATTTPENTALPAGWHTYTGSGFSIPVPDSWSMSNSSGMILFRESGGLGRVLGVSQSEISNPDPTAALAEQEGEQSRKSGYQQLRLASIDYRGYEAADWEWLYNSDRGTRIHARRRGFIASGKFYSISWYVAEPNWQANLSSFDVVANGFKVRGG